MTNENFFTPSDLQMFINNLTHTGDKELPNIWRNVVSKIGKKDLDDNETLSLGEKLAANSHVVDLKNGVLLVEANHSGWIQYLKFNQKFILQGLKWALPDLKINNLAFRVAGSTANLSDIYDNQLKKEKMEMDKKIAAQEKELSKLENKNDDKRPKGSLPPEILARFEHLKNSMKE